MGKIKETFLNFKERLVAPPTSVVQSDEVEERPYNLSGQFGKEGRWLVLAPLDSAIGREDIDCYEIMDTTRPEKRCYGIIASTYGHYKHNRLVVHKFIHLMQKMSERSKHFPQLLECGQLGDSGLVYGQDGAMIEETKIEVVDRPFAIYSHSAIPLASLLSFSDQGFIPIPIALAAGQGMVRALAALHRAGFIHRGVSPHSFGHQLPASVANLQHFIVCLDFALCIPFPTKPRRFLPFVGVPRYCSPRAESGRETGPSDDILSVIYVVAEFIAGRLPWRAIKTLPGIAEFKLHFSKSRVFAQMPREIRFLMLETQSPTPLEYRPIIDLFQGALNRYAPLVERVPHFLAS
ncbi:Protein kinase domain-containing protein [Aphelenchoides besseyi]|nr:Protein kinase domain-containing protein [Aphelenchoides besseyi]KAI6199099.1 Protein kinase domain-containing protein [Aphelenchoides besseyi]